VLVDEINRAPPKTQWGLLDSMQERYVTADAVTHELARPFILLATQNPVKYAGTHPLPENQLDHFMVRVSPGYPSPDGELVMLAEPPPVRRTVGARARAAARSLGVATASWRRASS
jgi:MoxR-like ATPase